MSSWDTFTLTNQFDGDIRKRYFEEAANFSKAMTLLYKEVGYIVDLKNKPYLKDSIETSGRHYEEVAEGVGEAIKYDPRTVAQLLHRVKLFKAKLVVTREANDDDLYNYVMKHVGRLSELALRTMERDWVDLFINTCFTFNALRDQRDGKALAAIDHPAGLNGLTYANTPAVGSALSDSTLAAAIQSFDALRDDSGLVDPLSTNRFQLITHTSRRLYAQQLVNSTGSLADYKNSAVINPVSRANNIQIEVLASPYQTSLTQWTLVPVGIPESKQAAQTIVRDSPQIEKDVKKDPDLLQWIGRYRLAHRVLNPRGWYSNPGA